MCCLERLNKDSSTSCIKSSMSVVSSKAFVSTILAKRMSLRAKDFCAMMLAWYSILAEEVTRLESSAT